MLFSFSGDVGCCGRTVRVTRALRGGNVLVGKVGRLTKMCARAGSCRPTLSCTRGTLVLGRADRLPLGGELRRDCLMVNSVCEHVGGASSTCCCLGGALSSGHVRAVYTACRVLCGLDGRGGSCRGVDLCYSDVMICRSSI